MRKKKEILKKVKELLENNEDYEYRVDNLKDITHAASKDIEYLIRFLQEIEVKTELPKLYKINERLKEIKENVDHIKMRWGIL